MIDSNKLNLCIVTNRKEDIGNTNGNIFMFLSEFPEGKVVVYYDDKLTDEIKNAFYHSDKVMVVDGGENKGLLLSRYEVTKIVPESEYIIWLDSDDSLIMTSLKILANEGSEIYDIIGDYYHNEMWCKIWKSGVLRKSYEWFKVPELRFNLDLSEASIANFVTWNSLVPNTYLDTKDKFPLINYTGFHGLPVMDRPEFWKDNSKNPYKLSDLLCQLLVFEIENSVSRGFFGSKTYDVFSKIPNLESLKKLHGIFLGSSLQKCDESLKPELRKRFEELLYLKGKQLVN